MIVSVKTKILNKLFSENHSLVREYQKASVRLVLTGLKAARINFNLSRTSREIKRDKYKQTEYKMITMITHWTFRARFVMNWTFCR